MHKLENFLAGCFLLFLTACTYYPSSDAYEKFYSHLNHPIKTHPIKEDPYFLIVLVEARHLDYSSPHSFFKTVAKHPSDGSKNGDVGHAWVYLQGMQNGQRVCLEGGHSGELGQLQPRYMEGVFLQYEKGDPNPISYLWESQQDGFFQYGSGKHRPTFAAKVKLTKEEFERILRFVQVYDFKEYAITGNQCSSFVSQVASLIGWPLDCEITIPIDQYVKLGKDELCLWQDPMFAEITFSSPDILERSLMLAVEEGIAEDARAWYHRTHPFQIGFTLEDFLRFPNRYGRFKSL